jgi:hypothetical protein
MVSILPPHKNHRKAEENRFLESVIVLRDVRLLSLGLRQVGGFGHNPAS